MPNYENYLSDASLSESDSDNEIEEEELRDPRDIDYENIERLLDSRGPPPVIEYITKLGVVTLRSCIVELIRTDITRVVDSTSASNWKAFWSNCIEKKANFTFEEFDAMGEFCLELCHCCIPEPSRVQVQSCIIRILAHGNFLPPYMRSIRAPRPTFSYALRL